MKENRLIRELRSDPITYVDSVGKHDRQTVIDALQDGGESTALRMCLGVSTRGVPLRVLSYIASALAVRAQYLPKAQLQFVYPVYAANRANSVSIVDAKEQALGVRSAASSVLYRHDNDQRHGRLTHLFDRTIREGDTLDRDVASVLGDTRHASRLMTAAASRQGDAASYVASHLRVHDLLADLDPVDIAYCDLPLPVERVVSIGAQSERPFYAARMACRKAGVLSSCANVQTGQLFTKHILPPYQECKQGEPDLSEINERPVDISHPDITTEHEVSSVSRDLYYLQSELTRQALQVQFDFGYAIRKSLIPQEELR